MAEPTKKPYSARTDAEDLLADTGVEPEGSFSLEEILAEFGGSRQQKILEEAEQEAAPHLPPELSAPPEPAAAPEEEPPELPPEPHPVSVERAVGQTVDNAMKEREEHRDARRPKRGLFSRQRMKKTETLEETEELYDPPGPEPEPEIEEPIGPEEPLEDALRKAAKTYRRMSQPLVGAFLMTALMSMPYIAERAGYTVLFWEGDPLLQAGISAAVLAVMCILCRGIFVRAFRRLRRGRCCGELLLAVSALAALADCAAVVWLPERTAVPLYALPVCAGMLFGQWGCALREKGRSDTFRTAALDSHPPYLVTDVEMGACKQAGRVEGFWTDTMADSLPERWQAVLTPLVLVATVVFAGLGSLGLDRGSDFLLNWSAILAASGSLMLPLTDALPAARLAKRLQKVGCAVAGCAGAEKISRKKCMIVTDRDLFPPGAISLNGVKLFGEERRRAMTYAATLACASGCGLGRLFRNLMIAEDGQLEVAEDFSFYEEGGFSANIHGESVLLGTASFMRKMNVRLPSGLNLRTGVYLSVDGQLSAVFAVKYNPTDNVDWALRLLRRNHIVPVLASRDPNVTPALLKRKFRVKLHVEYPAISERLAMSEQETATGRPRALLLREGLLPYAETVTGSRRLCRAMRGGTAFALLGSVAGALLTFYLTFLGSYDLMSPLRLLVFLLLWALPCFILDDLSGRY